MNKITVAYTKFNASLDVALCFGLLGAGSPQ